MNVQLKPEEANVNEPPIQPVLPFNNPVVDLSNQLIQDTDVQQLYVYAAPQNTVNQPVQHFLQPTIVEVCTYCLCLCIIIIFNIQF